MRPTLHTDLRHIFVVLSALVFTATTPPAAMAEALTLDAARAALHTSNADAARAEVAIERVATARARARAGWMPSVDLEAFAMVNDREQTLDIDNPYAPLEPWLRAAEASGAPDPTALIEAPGTSLVSQHQLDAGATLTVTQPLWSPGARAAASVADAAVDLAGASRDEVLWQLDAALIDLWFGAVALDRRIEVAEGNVELARIRYERATRADDLGVGVAFEITRAEVALSAAQRDLQTARIEHQRVIDAIAVLLHRAPDFTIDAPEPVELTRDADALVRTALSSRPDLARVRSSALLTESGARTVRAAAVPVVALRANGQLQRPTDLMTDVARYNVQLVASWSLHDGGDRAARLRSIDHEVAEQAFALDALIERATGDVRQTLLRLDEAELNRDQAAREVALAEANLEVTRRAREAGAATDLDLEAAIEQRYVAELGFAAADVAVVAEQHRLRHRVAGW